MGNVHASSAAPPPEPSSASSTMFPNEDATPASDLRKDSNPGSIEELHKQTTGKLELCYS